MLSAYHRKDIAWNIQCIYLPLCVVILEAEIHEPKDSRDSKDREKKKKKERNFQHGLNGILSAANEIRVFRFIWGLEFVMVSESSRSRLF